MNSKVDNITYLLILNILSSCKSLIQKANLNFRESLSEKSLTPKWTKILIKRLVYGRVLFIIFVIFFRCSFQKYDTQVTEFANFECFWDQEPELHILCFSTRQLDSATVQWKGQFTGHVLVRGQNPTSVRAAFRRVNYFLLLFSFEGECDERKKFHDSSNSALHYLCFHCDTNFESTTNI